MPRHNRPALSLPTGDNSNGSGEDQSIVWSPKVGDSDIQEGQVAARIHDFQSRFLSSPDHPPHLPSPPQKRFKVPSPRSGWYPEYVNASKSAFGRKLEEATKVPLPPSPMKNPEKSDEGRKIEHNGAENGFSFFKLEDMHERQLRQDPVETQFRTIQPAADIFENQALHSPHRPLSPVFKSMTPRAEGKSSQALLILSSTHVPQGRRSPSSVYSQPSTTGPIADTTTEGQTHTRPQESRPKAIGSAPHSLRRISQSIDEINELLGRKEAEAHSQASPVKSDKHPSPVPLPPATISSERKRIKLLKTQSPTVRRYQHLSEDANELSPARRRRFEMGHIRIPPPRIEEKGEETDGGDSLSPISRGSPSRERDERRFPRRRAYLSTDNGSLSSSRPVSPLPLPVEAKSPNLEARSPSAVPSPFTTTPRKIDDVFILKTSSQTSRPDGMVNRIPPVSQHPLDSPAALMNTNPSREEERKSLEALSPVKNLISKDQNYKPAALPHPIHVPRKIANLDKLSSEHHPEVSRDNAKERPQERQQRITEPPSPRLEARRDSIMKKEGLRGMSLETIPISVSVSSGSLGGIGIDALELEVSDRRASTQREGGGEKEDMNDAAAYGADGAFETSSSSSRATSFLLGMSQLTNFDGHLSEEREPLLGEFKLLSRTDPFPPGSARAKENKDEGLQQTYYGRPPFERKLHQPSPLRLPLRARGNWEKGRRRTLADELEELGLRSSSAWQIQPNSAAKGANRSEDITEQASDRHRRGRSIDVHVTTTASPSSTSSPASPGAKGRSRIPKPVAAVGGAEERNYRASHEPLHRVQSPKRIQSTIYPMSPTGQQPRSSEDLAVKKTRSSPKRGSKETHSEDTEEIPRPGLDYGAEEQSSSSEELESPKRLKVTLTMGQEVEEVVRIEVHPSPGAGGEKRGRAGQRRSVGQTVGSPLS